MTQFNVTLPWEGAPEAKELGPQILNASVFHEQGDGSNRHQIGKVVDLVNRTNVGITVSVEVENDEEFPTLNPDGFRLGRPSAVFVEEPLIGGGVSPEEAAAIRDASDGSEF